MDGATYTAFADYLQAARKSPGLVRPAALRWRPPLSGEPRATDDGDDGATSLVDALRGARRREAEREALRRARDAQRRADHPDDAAAEDRCEQAVMDLAAAFLAESRVDHVNEGQYLAGISDAGRILWVCRESRYRSVVDLAEEHAAGNLDLGAFGVAWRLWMAAEDERVLRTPIPIRLQCAGQEAAVPWWQLAGVPQ